MIEREHISAGYHRRRDNRDGCHIIRKRQDPAKSSAMIPDDGDMFMQRLGFVTSHKSIKLQLYVKCLTAPDSSQEGQL